ncbi:endonuclease/exonuclease/phosphatase family protein [Bacillus subtilis]|uniref:endonuclease/exonuclease/phosphatase family protein n=1 Tax=Bacillus subtilis TaxID=1423 RepID=UPI0013F63E2F|nr:endonuclease/exonuclease/phosphatase family protein [Bacillus subtilis]MCS4324027.1 endonuclease/exonuclease/phosphatase family protein [Bacillus subtilis]NQE96802.1 endonuclease/exonuclease/phosphatase family protein [Bacillus subtilis]UWS55259.1 endonuclease/exonuclease/phosphatase family protein [Bacillus subtilis]WBU32448.1 endonuclease/exonuclease/phosphatase family protein [Bacillus subtilis]
MNCFFWNTAKKDVNNILIDAIKNYDLDLVSLAEYDDKYREDLIRGIANKELDYYHIPQIGCKRIHLFTKNKPSKIEHLSETGYYTIKRIPHETLGPLIFAFLHFPSKMYMDDFDHFQESTEFRRELEKVELECNSTFSVIVGDFNMNPFEKGMMAAAALHAYPTRKEALKESRVIKGRRYNMFYNPMWNNFGDQESPTGTYYYRGGSHHYQIYWNIFDQVLVRPSLVPYLLPDNVKILNEINNNKLVDENGIPSVSDHLPLFYRIL